MLFNKIPFYQLYTVVQHVKHFNDVVEFGENQEFTDDFEYLETGLKSSQPLNTRCLRYVKQRHDAAHFCAFCPIST